MSEIEQRRADRLRVMDAIFKETGASEMTAAMLWPIREALGFTDEYMGAIVDYLEHEGLIDPLRTMTGTYTPMQTSVTHRGIKEMELSHERPEKPTEHFPPSINITVHGNVTGSPIQVASTGSNQFNRVGKIGADDGDWLRKFVAEVETRMPQLQQELGTDAAADLESDANLIKSQIDLPKRKNHVIQACLGSIKSILEIGAGGVASAFLLGLL